MPHHLTASMEDYLEAVYEIAKRNKIARVRDIAARLGVKMPSVHAAIKQLTTQNLIKHDSYGYIELTKQGEKISERISKTHGILKSFLVEILKISPEVAEKDACEMEHGISPESLERVVNILGFLRSCPKVGKDWSDRYENFCNHGTEIEKCSSCIQDCLIALGKKEKEKV